MEWRVKMKRLYMIVCFLCLLAVPANAASVKLAWDPLDVPDLTVVGVKIHYGTATATYDQIHDAGLNTTTATVEGLTQAITYFFVAQAYDQLGNVSPYSNEVSTRIPADVESIEIRLRLAMQPGPLGSMEVLASWDVKGQPDGYYVLLAPIPWADRVVAIDVGTRTQTTIPVWGVTGYMVAVLPRLNGLSLPGKISNVEVIGG